MKKELNNNIGNAIATNKQPQELSIAEMIEFAKLKTKLFQGRMFVEFSSEELKSPEFKRYDELMKKKMAHLDFFDKVNNAVVCN